MSRVEAPATQCECGREGPHPAAGKDGKPTGSLLCAEHFKTLDKTLRDIEDEASTLEYDPFDPDAYAPLPSMALAMGEGHGGTLASQQTPVRLDAVVLGDPRRGTGWAEEDEERRAARTDSAMKVLIKWTDQVREEHELVRETIEWFERIPMLPGPICGSVEAYTAGFGCGHESCLSLLWRRTAWAERTVKTECRLLIHQLTWIDDQPWVPEFYRAMRRLLSQLQQVNGASAQRPIPGKCPNLIDDQECGGPLWPTKPKETSQSEKWTGSAPNAIRCGACNARWEGAGPLAFLAIVLDKQKKEKAS